MKPISVGFALIFAGVTAAISAAQQAQAPPSEPAHKVYVLTGCLTGSPAPTAPFKLTGAAAVGQAPTEGLAAGAPKQDMYELLPVTGLTEQGLAREALQTHVGKKVEVTVRPAEVAPVTSSPSPSTASTAKPEETPQRYTVTQIKTLAASCL